MFDEGYKLEAAIEIATRAHAGQVRKYTGEPYIVHPFGVAGLVRSVTDDEDMICAALLHDVVEDTPIEHKLIYGLFGNRVGLMVEGLTDISVPEDGNRAMRKGIDRKHTAEQSPDTHTIKLADLIDNTKTITECDHSFAKVYMKEKELLLDVLKDGDQQLWALARETIDRWKAQESELEEVEEARQYLKMLRGGAW